MAKICNYKEADMFFISCYSLIIYSVGADKLVMLTNIICFKLYLNIKGICKYIYIYIYIHCKVLGRYTAPEMG